MRLYCDCIPTTKKVSDCIPTVIMPGLYSDCNCPILNTVGILYQNSIVVQLYIMYKVHKEQCEDGSWPTRPVCSDVTSYPHILGKWVMEQLQPVAQCQPSYFKDTFELRRCLMIWSSHPMPNSSLQMPYRCTPTLKRSQPFWKYPSICGPISPLLTSHMTPTHLLPPLKLSLGTITSS
jgi:hypothetical protein